MQTVVAQLLHFKGEVWSSCFYSQSAPSTMETVMMSQACAHVALVLKMSVKFACCSSF